MIEAETPFTKRPLKQALLQSKLDVTHFFGDLPVDVLFAPQPTGWSPAGHMEHLIKSVAQVTLGMRLPRPVLAVLFGRSTRISRRFEEIRRLYRGKLADGFKAPRWYRPARRMFKGDLNKQRVLLLGKWDATITALLRVTDSWQEADLDRYRLPHPSLGKLSVREILLFTLYHNGHHLDSQRNKYVMSLEIVEQA